ncbi:MAG: twin-arginine translocase subunit TatC [Dehalococcoidia bacterium]|nr:twin-arginine translocase subunit TatC [Dehalococcoidia bacterium]
MSEHSRLSIAAHLDEIRRRLIYSVLFVVVCTGVGFVLAEPVIRFLTTLAPSSVLFIYTEVTEFWSTYFTVALVCGIVLSLPFLLYQLVMFVAPALTPREKKYLYTFMPAVFLFFAAGVAFGFFVLLPPALDFMLNPPFAADIAKPQIRIGNYISVVTRLLFIIGAAFEMPLVMLFLGKIRVLSVKRLTRFRKWVFVLAFVVSGIITPTMDPVNQTLLAVPLVVLFELGILLIRIFVPQRKP